MNALREAFFPEEMGAISPLNMFIAVVCSALLGAIIWFIYARSYLKSRRSVMYSSTFGLSLLAMTIITTAMLLAIGSRVGLSLGMVGALSIVRFRAAIKEPLEVVFLFWAIETGALLAAGLFILALCVNGLIAVLLFVFLCLEAPSESYLLILKGAVDLNRKSNFSQNIITVLMGLKKECGVDSVSRATTERWTSEGAESGGQTKAGTAEKTRMSSFELNYEVRISRSHGNLNVMKSARSHGNLNAMKSVCDAVMREFPEVKTAVWVPYNGDYV